MRVFLLIYFLRTPKKRCWLNGLELEIKPSSSSPHRRTAACRIIATSLADLGQGDFTLKIAEKE